MREIRFRGKRLDNGEWVYGYLIGNDVIVGEVVEFCEEYFNTEYWWRVDPKTVGQYTGLKDKNGKEIYEGDIVRAVKPGEYIPNRDDGGGIIDYVYRKPEERIFIVEYFGATFAIKEVPKSDKYYAPLDWIVEDENIEVIGNIYENSELLKGEENA